MSPLAGPIAAPRLRIKSTAAAMAAMDFSASTSSTGMSTSSLPEREGQFPHRRCRHHAVVQVFRNIAGPDGRVPDAEAGLAGHFVGRHPGRPQDRQDQPAVADRPWPDPDADPPHQFFRAEGPFSRRTPDIDTVGLKHEKPGIPPGQDARRTMS